MTGFAVFGSVGAVVVVRGGVVALASPMLFFALSMMACCLSLSFVRIGIKSDGTSVLSLKFSANFFRSLSFTALSRLAVSR